MRRTLALALLVLVAGAGVLAWLAVDATRGRAALTADRPELRALAAPGTVGLVSVDVAGIVDLEEGLFGMAAGPLRPEAPAEDEDVLARLRRRGLDPRRSVDRVVAAARLVPPPDGGEPELRLAAVVAGRFRPPRIERVLDEDPAFAVRRVATPAGEALEVERLDPEDCEPGRRWHVALGPERLALAEAGELPWLLERLASRAPEGPDLAALPAPLGSPLLAGALFVEEARRVAEAHPLGRAGVRKAGKGLEETRTMAFAVGASAFPPRAVLAGGVESPSTARAEARAARWREALRRARASWEGRLGTLAALHDALAVTASGPVVRLHTRIDAETLRQLGRVPGELLAAALGSPGGAATERGGAAEVRYEEEPTPYEARTAASELPAYEPEQAFAEPADATAGPFGVWIDAVRSVEGAVVEDAPPAPGERLLALELEAAGTGVPNLGPASGASGLGATRATLRVTAVRSARGEDLLRAEHCGEARNGAAAAFDLTPIGGGADLLRAKKTLRLAPGTRLDDVASVEGEITLRLPVRVERRRLPAREGEALEAAGLRLEVTRARERSVSYRLSGEAGRLLELRGLAADGRALAGAGSSSMGAFLGPGSSGTVRFHGPVDALEAVLAAEEERVVRRFALRGGRPTPGREAGPAPERPRAPRSPEALLRRAPPTPAPGHDAPRAEAVAGPFRLRVTRVWSFRGHRPRMRIHAPDAPLLRASASAAELRLDRARLADGSSHPLAVRRFAAFGEAYGLEGLRAELTPALALEGAEDAELAGLEGALVLRAPARTRTLALDAEPGARARGAGLDARLVRIGREGLRLALAHGAGRLVAVRAFDRSGRALAVPEVVLGSDADSEPGAPVLAEVEVAGSPARLELDVAEALRERALPFALRLAAPEEGDGR